MKEIQVIQYQADDGRVFKTKEECLKHEERILQVKKALDLIPVVKSICVENVECSLCPFYNDYDSRCCFGYNEEEYNSSQLPCNSWSR